MAIALALAACDSTRGRRLTLGVPTTVRDSGLLDVLEHEYEAMYPGTTLRVVAGGSGELLALAERSDLDVLITHSPRAEAAFMQAGHGAARRRVMQNEFVIVGPESDPAGVRGMSDAVAALSRIRQADARFLSRGDDSGTHRKEVELWGMTRRGQERWPGHRETGQGMGPTLLAAAEMRAYTIVDRGTLLNMQVDLEILVEGDPRLLNVYSVILPASDRDEPAARSFMDWIVSSSAQRAIAAYGGARFGSPLFEPAANDTARGSGASLDRLVDPALAFENAIAALVLHL